MHANRSTLPSIRKCQGPHSIKANVVTHVRHLFGRKPQTQGFRMDDIAILPVLLAQVRNNPSMPEPERSPSVLVQTSTSVPRTMSLGHWSTTSSPLLAPHTKQPSPGQQIESLYRVATRTPGRGFAHRILYELVHVSQL